MSNKLELAEGRCIIKPNPEELELYTPNGLYLGASKKKPNGFKTATVVQVHPDIYQVEVGDRVFYEGKGSPIEFNGEDCFNMNIGDIVGVINT